MPSLKIEKHSPLSPQESFARLANMLSNDKDLKKLDPSFKANFDTTLMTGVADGSLFKAKMNVVPNSDGSRVEILIDLPFHLTLVKGMIEKTLSKKLEEALA